MNKAPHNSIDFCRRGKQWGTCTTLGAHLLLAGVVFVGVPSFFTPLPAPAMVQEQAVLSLRVVPAPVPVVPDPAPAPPAAQDIVNPPAPAPQPVSPTVTRPRPAKTKTSKRVTTAPAPVVQEPAQAQTPTRQAQANNAQVRAQAQARQTALSYFMALLERYKHYPRAARKLGLEGLISVELRIDAQGNITHLDMGSTDAHPVLRKALGESLHKIRAHWQQQQGGQALSLTVPVRFSLQDGG